MVQNNHASRSFKYVAFFMNKDQIFIAIFASGNGTNAQAIICLLYTSDAADDQWRV